MGRLRWRSAQRVKTVEFLLPGDPATRTGGYIYDGKIIDGLRAGGWTVNLHRLHDGFPRPDSAALAHAGRLLCAIDDHALVVVDGLAFGAMPAVAKRHGGRLRLIALVHHPLAAESGLDPASIDTLVQSERSALGCAHHVIVTSTHTAARLSARYDVPTHKLSVVEPGTDPPRGARAARADSSVLRLLCVATVTPRKGHESLIAALAPLAGERWQLRCAGSLERAPETAEHIRSAIADAALGAQIELLGEIDDDALAGCFAWANAFVLASRHEGYGMALAEAIAHGLPVITTAGGAAADTVGADASLLVAPGDNAALTRALQRLLHDRALRMQLATAARRRARQLPDWHTASATMDKVLSRMQRG